MTDTVISLDTNIWIFGLLGEDPFCETILLNLPRFHIIIPDQIRTELERNLSNPFMDRFYLLAMEAGAQFDFEPVPHSFIDQFEQKGLKKGDLIIGAFCQWRHVDVIVSDNRDFLKGLSGDHSFQVMSPRMFCEKNRLL